jgi:hypothetical protein
VPAAKLARLLVAGFLGAGTPAMAQEHGAQAGMGMPGANHGAPAGRDADDILICDLRMTMAQGSGTSWLPVDRVTPSCAHDESMVHFALGDDWTAMVHGSVGTQFTDHEGPRGDSKLYATSMAMISAGKTTDWGRAEFRAMMSLEPLMAARGYPNLFATGETAGGAPLVDRQHPHDLFMELTARLDFDVGDDLRLFLYGGPVGEPAIGPAAFMHRTSARYNPEPPITHHWFDSTHITYGVVTAGLSLRGLQLEGSAFRGAEPDEHRWDIETPKLDSWSIRGSWRPSTFWVLQTSYATIEQPEILHPGEDERRFTASAHYGDGRLSAMLAFSNKDRVPGRSLTAWLGEANWNVDKANTLFGRVENVANDEFFPDHDHPLHGRAFRVTKFQLGYARRIAVGPFELALGGAAAAYAKPAALDADYGNDPLGYTLFARLSLGH